MHPTEKSRQFNKDRFDILSIPGYLTQPNFQRMVSSKLFLEEGFWTQHIARICLNIDGQKNKSDNTTYLQHWKTIPTKLHWGKATKGEELANCLK